MGMPSPQSEPAPEQTQQPQAAPRSASQAAAQAAPGDPLTVTGSIVIREFGPYQILERAETDPGSGTVAYRARQKSLGRMVRVIVLPRAAAAKPGFLARFQRQVGVAARLRHDNVLSAFDTGSLNGIQYVVFEELDGKTLEEDVSGSGPLPLPRVLEIGIEMARALDHVATQGLVHRNVRPASIHLPEHSPSKLTGLSFAKVRQASGAETWIDHDTDSAHCVAPEIVRESKGIDIRADLYGLGCSLYFAATGRPPFPGGTPATILARHVNETPPDVRGLIDGSKTKPEVIESFARALDRTLRKSPSERYAKPADFARDLELARAGRPVDRGPGTPLWGEKGISLPISLPWKKPAKG